MITGRIERLQGLLLRIVLDIHIFPKNHEHGDLFKPFSFLK
ncbi:unnamed protein product [Larinioides sclopetarius]|uniref:Uncharacterized protein n=1 Tax=Larinioides sclopetarius TaxID=280406 RepID=A0AAV2ATW3_9ARAC